MQWWELGIPTCGYLSTYFQQKKVGITFLPRAHLYVEAESNFEVFNFGPDSNARN